MRFIFTIMFCFLCALAYADGLDKIMLKSSSAVNATNHVNSSSIAGYVERVDITFATNNLPLDVVLISSNAFTKTSTTLFDSDSASTNVSFYPRLNGHGTDGAVGFTNDAQRYCLLDEILYLTTTIAATNAQITTVTVIYEAK